MVYKDDLSPELRKYCKEVLNEDLDRRDEDIEHIRQWIKKQPHLNARTGKFYLIKNKCSKNIIIIVRTHLVQCAPMQHNMFFSSQLLCCVKERLQFFPYTGCAGTS